MKRVLMVGIVAALCASLPGHSLARQGGRVVETLPKSRPKPPARGAPAPTPGVSARDPEAARQRYVERLGGAANCEEFMAVASVVEDARPILISAAKQTKGEFETSQEFVDRYASGIASAVPGANILALRIPLSSSSLDYDADRGQFSVSATSVNSAVESIACDRVYCSSTLGGVAWDIGSYYSNALAFDVPREVAVEVKNAPSLVVGFPLKNLMVGKKEYREGFEVAIKQRCVVLVSGDRVYPAISSFWFSITPSSSRAPINPAPVAPTADGGDLPIAMRRY